VLFPLELDRVIYIDADQIVRTDLIELMKMKFEGAPYAFTPFCDSRVETEPFRFWKQGFWKDHLQQNPYHISALFAIDLPRFRQMSVGDWLRYYYHGLSGNPESLSNLDQDLPNYLQPMIPIFSLPQEWLWCETWCDDASLATAKTIDLCNNPLTKAPKLHIAQTMIAGWPGLDAKYGICPLGLMNTISFSLVIAPIPNCHCRLERGIRLKAEGSFLQWQFRKSFSYRPSWTKVAQRNQRHGSVSKRRIDFEISKSARGNQRGC
jgi:hypothetical protein